MATGTRKISDVPEFSVDGVRKTAAPHPAGHFAISPEEIADWRAQKENLLKRLMALSPADQEKMSLDI